MTKSSAHAVLSSELDGVECHTPHAVRSGDTAWAVWQGYRQDEEHIYARASHGGELTPLETVTSKGGRNHSPYIGLVQDVPTSVWISQDLWLTYAVFVSTRSISGWETPQKLGSNGFVVSLHADSAEGRMAVVWCEAASPGSYRIRLTVNAGDGWSEPVDITTTPHWAQRPEVAVTGDGCWVAWDAYVGGTFGIHTAFVDRDGSVAVREVVTDHAAETAMVTAEAWQLVPSLAIDSGGNPWIAWLCRQEVVSDGNVLDQWPVARVARRVEGQWQLVCDAGGSPDLGVLAWGMLEWQGLGVWGYLGRRRKPMVAASPDGGVWLMWERKELQNGSTPTTSGVLCARYIDGTGEQVPPVVQDTRAVAVGPRYYTPVANDAIDARNDLWVTARVAPEVSVEDVCLDAYALGDAPAFHGEGKWFGVSPVAMGGPRPDDRPRVQIQDPGGSNPSATESEPELSLYWADLHVHTTHSADAEGYVDELIAYARDLAHLDCVAFSDNDKHLLSLTGSEYDLDYHFARHFRYMEDLVLLPAYEWSQMRRGSGSRTANHRTVIAGREQLPLLRYTEVEGEPLAALAAHAEQYGAILHPHHEHWDHLSESRTETNMEVCSGWRVHMLDPVYREKIHQVLLSGRKLGFIGCSDGHRRTAGTGGGLTGIYAEELTRSAILEALRQHRCFATDGSRIALQLWVSGVFMGGEGETQTHPEIRWNVQLTEQPAIITLVRDGQPIMDWETSDAQASGRYTDVDAAPGSHFYYLCVEQSMAWRNHLSNVAPAWGPRAWSSPVWVEFNP
jgi:hypothetical protein